MLLPKILKNPTWQDVFPNFIKLENAQTRNAKFIERMAIYEM
jgi:hypothetical protein